jgi:hypothetical protein
VKHLEDGRWNYGQPEAWISEPSHWQLVKEAEMLTELWKQRDLKVRGICFWHLLAIDRT